MGDVCFHSLLRLDHVQLAMPHGGEAAARAFYADVLRLREEGKPEPLGARGGCWFRQGDVIIHLGVEAEFAPQKKAHPACCVAKLDALAQRLTAAGFPVHWDDALPDRRRFYTADPFGNRLEFLRDGDGFTQR